MTPWDFSFVSPGACLTRYIRVWGLIYSGFKAEHPGAGLLSSTGEGCDGNGKEEGPGPPSGHQITTTVNLWLCCVGSPLGPGEGELLVRSMRAGRAATLCIMSPRPLALRT